MKKMKYAAIMAAALALYGCEDTDTTDHGPVEQEEQVEHAEAPEPEPADEVEPEEAAQEGLPLGESAEIGDWTVTVVELDTDPTAAIMEENQFNEDAEHGYVMALVEATYNGSDTGLAWLDLRLQYHGTDARFYDTDAVVLPDDLMAEPEVSSGGSVNGNVAFDIPSEALEGGTIVVEPTFGGQGVEWEGA